MRVVTRFVCYICIMRIRIGSHICAVNCATTLTRSGVTILCAFMRAAYLGIGVIGIGCIRIVIRADLFACLTRSGIATTYRCGAGILIRICIVRIRVAGYP